MAQGIAKDPKSEKLRKQRIGIAHKGRNKSPEHILKILASRRSYVGKDNPNYKGGLKRVQCRFCKKEFIEKNGCKNIYCSRECKWDYQRTLTGEQSYHYKDGTYSHGNRNYKYGPHNRRWRQAILERDHYSCVECGSKRELHVDHIVPFKENKDLRYEINNGRTLCKFCHYEITFRKSPLDNWEAYSRWAMVTRGKPAQAVAAAETNRGEGADKPM